MVYGFVFNYLTCFRFSTKICIGMLEHDLAVGITFKSLRKKENVTT